MHVTSVEQQFLEQNIEEELADYQKYMEQAKQATNPQLARLWQMFAQDERRHAERQQAVLELAGLAAPTPRAVAPPATVLPAPVGMPAPPGGFQWRGAPWPGPAIQPRAGCCGG